MIMEASVDPHPWGPDWMPITLRGPHNGGSFLHAETQSLARGEEALSPAAQRGLVFVRTYCAHCHSIDKVSPSPLVTALPLRTLHERYPVENLEEPLAEGIITGHPSMPEFRLDPGQVSDVIAYLKSLER